MAESNVKHPLAETPADFRKRAAECNRLAAIAGETKSREIFLQIAARWRKLADEDEAHDSGGPTVRPPLAPE